MQRKQKIAPLGPVAGDREIFKIATKPRGRSSFIAKANLEKMGKFKNILLATIILASGSFAIPSQAVAGETDTVLERSAKALIKKIPFQKVDTLESWKIHYENLYEKRAEKMDRNGAFWSGEIVTALTFEIFKREYAQIGNGDISLESMPRLRQKPFQYLTDLPGNFHAGLPVPVPLNTPYLLFVRKIELKNNTYWSRNRQKDLGLFGIGTLRHDGKFEFKIAMVSVMENRKGEKTRKKIPKAENLIIEFPRTESQDWGDLEGQDLEYVKELVHSEYFDGAHLLEITLNENNLKEVQNLYSKRPVKIGEIHTVPNPGNFYRQLLAYDKEDPQLRIENESSSFIKRTLVGVNPENRSTKSMYIFQSPFVIFDGVIDENKIFAKKRFLSVWEIHSKFDEQGLSPLSIFEDVEEGKTLDSDSLTINDSVRTQYSTFRMRLSDEMEKMFRILLP